MQKIILIVVIILISVLSFSCKKEKIIVPKAKYSIETKTTTINWTAFKTTQKLPVKGKFNTINVINNKVSESPIDAINNVEFTIPVNSIDTQNKDRDSKIVTNFFGTMKNTTALTGKISLSNNGKGTINLKMNGISNDFPMTYIISGQLIEISATINLDNWKAQAAIKALNLICNDLHKGDDGISKTWNEVELNIVSYLKVE